jgi:hypothetical protein
MSQQIVIFTQHTGHFRFIAAIKLCFGAAIRSTLNEIKGGRVATHHPLTENFIDYIVLLYTIEAISPM